MAWGEQQGGGGGGRTVAEGVSAAWGGAGAAASWVGEDGRRHGDHISQWRGEVAA